MDMSFKRVPRRFLIEKVKRMTVLVNSIPRKHIVDVAMSPRETIIEKEL